MHMTHIATILYSLPESFIRPMIAFTSSVCISQVLSWTLWPKSHSNRSKNPSLTVSPTLETIRRIAHDSSPTLLRLSNQVYSVCQHSEYSKIKAATPPSNRESDSLSKQNFLLHYYASCKRPSQSAYSPTDPVWARHTLTHLKIKCFTLPLQLTESNS